MKDNSSLPEDIDKNPVFSDLSLTIGTTLTIETISPVRKYPVQLLGYAENKSILISTPLRDGHDVLLDKDCVIAVRLLEGKNVCAFETQVLYRSIQPYTYYHLAYPKKITVLQIRNSERVDTQLEIAVDSDFDIIGDWPKAATINNLSKTGARMVSSHRLGDKTQEIYLKFDVDVSGIKKSVCLKSIIRNIEKNDTEDDNVWTFGVQFIELTDEETLTLSTYIYEHDK